MENSLVWLRRNAFSVSLSPQAISYVFDVREKIETFEVRPEKVKEGMNETWRHMKLVGDRGGVAYGWLSYWW